MTTIGIINKIPLETNVFQKTYEIEWKISNFSSLSEETGNCYFSPAFSFANNSWCLKIYPNGQPSKMSVGCIGLNLYLRKSSFNLPISIEFTLGLKKLYGGKMSEHHYEYTFKSGNGYGVYGCFCRSELFEEKSDLLPADVLTVFCNLKYPEPVEISNLENATVRAMKHLDQNKGLSSDQNKAEDCAARSSISLHENKILQDFKEFYFKKEDCDVIFKVKGQEFPAHRAILRARSPVFASTFRHDTKEKITGVIDIEDCESSSFSDFLCFLYCGDSDIISVENVFSLFTTGDKYDVQDLRLKCVEFMKENLSAETFCDTITLALLHSETEWITLATDFFKKHALEITKTVKWQSFSDNYPRQSNELLIKALEDKSSNE